MDFALQLMNFVLKRIDFRHVLFRKYDTDGSGTVREGLFPPVFRPFSPVFRPFSARFVRLSLLSALGIIQLDFDEFSTAVREGGKITPAAIW